MYIHSRKKSCPWI